MRVGYFSNWIHSLININRKIKKIKETWNWERESAVEAEEENREKDRGKGLEKLSV
jgi:hypothetical protein